MCRSFFGEQEGKFEVCIGRISAVKIEDTLETSRTEKTPLLTGESMKDSSSSYRRGEVDPERAESFDAELGPAPKRPLSTMAVLVFSSAVAAFVILQCTSIPMTGQVKRWLGFAR
jgi:hypothetical protein